MTTTTLRPLTDRQRAVWQWIRRHNAEHRTGCGYRHLCVAFGWRSPTAAYGHVLALRSKGWVDLDPGRPNTIVPTLDSLEVCDD